MRVKAWETEHAAGRLRGKAWKSGRRRAGRCRPYARNGGTAESAGRRPPPEARDTKTRANRHHPGRTRIPVTRWAAVVSGLRADMSGRSPLRVKASRLR
jgi:hypothetical protein